MKKLKMSVAVVVAVIAAYTTLSIQKANAIDEFIQRAREVIVHREGMVVFPDNHPAAVQMLGNKHYFKEKYNCYGTSGNCVKLYKEDKVDPTLLKNLNALEAQMNAGTQQ